MSTDIYTTTFTAPRPQSEQACPEQQPNSAGGFSFVVGPFERLERFLILGAEGGSYYASQRELVLDNAESLLSCLKLDGDRTIATIVDVSENGRAPKQGPTFFALAVCATRGDERTRRHALEALPKVCRTGSHLQSFTATLKSLRSFGRPVRTAYQAWYSQPIAKLAYQLVKYQRRGGMSHRDILRLARVKPATPAHDAAFRWAVGAPLSARKVGRRSSPAPSAPSSVSAYPDLTEHLPPLIAAYEQLKAVDSEAEVIRLIGEHKFTHEMIPTKFQGSPAVWEALLPHMPVGALVRNLARMTAGGLFKPLSASTQMAVSTLSDKARVKGSRLHPLSALVALNTYSRGSGVRGKLSWTPSAPILAALDELFYTCFANVQPSGKRRYIALDVSGSMGCGEIAGMPGITPRVGAAAMAMITARTESQWCCYGFTSSPGDRRWSQEGRDAPREKFWAATWASKWGGSIPGGLAEIDISARRLDDVISTVSRLPMGGTDCALPMLHALEVGIEVDSFEIYTDSETWHGDVHPHEALQRYRKATGIPAKLIVVSMMANPFTIADPSDGGMLDVVGFDSAAPAVMADFIRGSQGPAPPSP